MTLSSWMSRRQGARRVGLLGLFAAGLVLATSVSAQTANAVDVGSQIPQADAVKEGLFPEDACKELEANGFKCMGFKPAVRYSLPASSFKVGSAELPDRLREQLDVFAEVLRTKKGSKQVVRVEGHADASGTSEANMLLSQRRAEAVKAYLVRNGADEAMLEAVGMGSQAPKVSGNPFAAENRRVEIGRQQNP